LVRAMTSAEVRGADMGFLVVTEWAKDSMRWLERARLVD
jgi:hypothetical protein